MFARCSQLPEVGRGDGPDGAVSGGTAPSNPFSEIGTRTSSEADPELHRARGAESLCVGVTGHVRAGCARAARRTRVQLRRRFPELTRRCVFQLQLLRVVGKGRGGSASAARTASAPVPRDAPRTMIVTAIPRRCVGRRGRPCVGRTWRVEAARRGARAPTEPTPAAPVAHRAPAAPPAGAPGSADRARPRPWPPRARPPRPGR